MADADMSARTGCIYFAFGIAHADVAEMLYE